MTNPQKRVALIAGPTASGKTALALRLAQTRPATIINADSAQVYAHLPILSAQPSAEEMASAPHRLFGYLDGREACSAARWAQDAKREIAAAWDEGRLPVLVGGTGLYLRTLLDGIAPIPEIDPEVRGAVRALPTPTAFEALAKEDAASAAAIAPNDDSRIKRALEVIRSTGKTVIEWRKLREGGIGSEVELHPLILLPPRDWLHERCDRRFETMMEQGAVEEVRALLALDLPPDAPVLRAIGVPEISAMLLGEIDRAEAIARGQAATRQYAKRQYTWFRNQPPKGWPRWDKAYNDSLFDEIERLFHF
ncbi:MAG: tRNA (adenosine(37)-N6)-dimethylallyltransferase MiaA [Sphingomonadales bacterium]|nr:tRNA (adenosine(37)-N6)-dimethylallyltransferase MiaA [Sphingomonadales bacterium]MBK9003271.1 tRNA (adenosine(37)-N6)-dimethylallyltransferase MiaA [Sphingomonadales bacterium]MBK9268519.1 tRNA (adenosine(37)-N6)-dimethylallyltransferase MiaA [Sphingomonadales bacterium]MBP6433732.1 tRNA (adenosine(37)-N6)-dimethylallyltransferase MiaA [Sphingorhabdus sp.]